MICMKERIYLIGFMAAGKTTVGRKLALTIGYQFIDLDDYFEERYKIDIHTFFGKYGEKLFRSLEHERLMKTFSMKDVVVATGGGTPCYLNSMEEINKNGTSVYLEMTPKAVASRLADAARKRPLVEGKSGDELNLYIKEKLEERVPYYKKAQLTVDGLDVNIAELVKLIEKQ